MEMNIYHKVCSKCGQEKLLEAFSKSKARPDGLQMTCRDCQAKYRAQNIDRYHEHHKRRYIEKKDEILQQISEWKKQNAERVYLMNKQYREENREMFQQWWRDEYKSTGRDKMKALRKLDPNKAYRAARKWAKENPGKLRAQSAKREDRITKATPGWVDLKAVEAIYVECAQTTKNTGIAHHVDHIVPLRGREVCGLHWELNLRIIPADENMIKGNVLDESLLT